MIRTILQVSFLTLYSLPSLSSTFVLLTFSDFLSVLLSMVFYNLWKICYDEKSNLNEFTFIPSPPAIMLELDIWHNKSSCNKKYAYNHGINSRTYQWHLMVELKSGGLSCEAFMAFVYLGLKRKREFQKTTKIFRSSGMQFRYTVGIHHEWTSKIILKINRYPFSFGT